MRQQHTFKDLRKSVPARQLATFSLQPLKSDRLPAKAFDLLQSFPFACRKASSEHVFLREMLIEFGHAGYVALFEIEADNLVTILAVRHQREDDYH